ncbi:MFS transporter [Rothia uropygioeca]|uniref:hypothetical protein n=1 Tax=Kocuria sp. 257 TaxID=2021970 RepID=UPI0010102FCE|nr:hypothetical protein [Kocuria sp. 257]
MTESSSAHPESDEPLAPGESPNPDRGPSEREVLVRRAPSVIAFLITGLVLGLIVAAISTFLGPADQKYTLGAIFGMMAVIFGTLGAVLGAVVGLIADRISRKKATRFRAVRIDDDPED